MWYQWIARVLIYLPKFVWSKSVLWFSSYVHLKQRYTMRVEEIITNFAGEHTTIGVGTPTINTSVSLLRQHSLPAAWWQKKKRRYRYLLLVAGKNKVIRLEDCPFFVSVITLLLSLVEVPPWWPIK